MSRLRGLFSGNAGQGMHWIRDKKRQRIYARDGKCCVWCGDPSMGLGLDHLVPRARFGDNHESNLVTSCGLCNVERGDGDPITFAVAKGAVMRLVNAIMSPLPPA